MLNDIYSNAKSNMQKTLDSLRRDFGTLRSGKVSTMILDNIKIDYYGTPTPINQVGSVIAKDATTIVITPWEKNLIKDIEKAILEANIGVNPNIDSDSVKLFFPPMTKEQRQAIAKEAAKAESIEEEEAEHIILSRIDSIITGYDNQIALINSIFDRDRKYIQLSTERIRYKTRSGMDTKTIISKLMEKWDVETLPILEDAVVSSRQIAADSRSLYERNTVEKDIEGAREGLTLHIRPTGPGKSFIEDLRSQISTDEIDDYVLSAIGEKKEITTEDFPVTTINEFVLFLLSTVRACEKDSPFTIENCRSGNCHLAHGVELPMLKVRRKYVIQ